MTGCECGIAYLGRDQLLKSSLKENVYDIKKYREDFEARIS
jgi:hypothetical protein